MNNKFFKYLSIVMSILVIGNGQEGFSMMNNSNPFNMINMQSGMNMNPCVNPNPLFMNQMQCNQNMMNVPCNNMINNNLIANQMMQSQQNVMMQSANNIMQNMPNFNCNSMFNMPMNNNSIIDPMMAQNPNNNFMLNMSANNISMNINDPMANTSANSVQISTFGPTLSKLLSDIADSKSNPDNIQALFDQLSTSATALSDKVSIFETKYFSALNKDVKNNINQILDSFVKVLANLKNLHNASQK